MADNKHFGGDKKNFKPAGNRPARSFNDRKPMGDRPARSFNDRKPMGDRPARSFGDHKPAGDRPARSFGDHKPASDRPARSFGDRKPMGDRPARSFGDHKPAGDRPARSFGDHKPAGDRPARSFDDRKPMGDRPARSFSDRKPMGDRPARSFDDRKPMGDRPARSFGDHKPMSERPARSFSDRKPMGDRPARSFDDRKPMGDRPVHSFKMHKPMADRPVRPPQTDGMPSRRIALQVLRKVTEEGAYASLTLNEKLMGCGLSLQDRRLVTRLVYDTLDNMMYLDCALSQVMAREDTDIKLRNILRLAACQVLIEDRIPESAATNTAVELCKELGMEGLAGVCNGILRNLLRKKEELVWPDPETEPVRARSIRYSVPEWLVERLTADYGAEEADALMAAKDHTAYVTVRPNLTRMNDEAFGKLLDKKVWEHENGIVPHSVHVRGMADIARDSDFTSGQFSIQSDASMLACLALKPKRGWRILDACAAPGGKSCFLAEMLDGTGRVQAWDIHPHRVALIEAQANRLKLENIRPITRDASVLREEMLESMDAVLLDAPCSGTGDLADKPDIRLHLEEDKLNELIRIQAQLLDTVSSYVKRGGVMVYSTCSVLKDENERQVQAFLARHPEFEPDRLPEEIPEQFRVNEEIGLQLLPHRDTVGGFYICRMRRKRL